MSSIRTLVLLKYEILTSDRTTWHLCETYPLEVRKNWAWRCALDVEHLAIGYKEAEECIAVAKKYSDRLATIGELKSAYYAAYNAAYYAANAAYCAYNAANAANAAIATTNTAVATTNKWTQYIEWLIEELCVWEEKQ